MNLKMTTGEKDSVQRVVTDAIKHLKSYGSIDEFAHLANLLYVFKKLTGENYEEGENANQDV